MKKQIKKQKLALKLLVLLIITVFVAGALFIAFGQKGAYSACPVTKQAKSQNLTSVSNNTQCLIDEECLVFEIPDQTSSGLIQVLDVFKRNSALSDRLHP